MLLLMEKHSCSILCISYITVRLYYRYYWTRFATEFNNNHSIQAWTVLQLVCSKIFSEQSISRALMSQQRLDYHPWSRSWDSWPARTRPFNKFYRSVTSQLFVVWHILYCRHLWYAHASCCKRIYCSAGHIRHRVTKMALNCEICVSALLSECFICQVSQVCDALANDTRLANGFNAMGFGQGGLFLWVTS